MVGERKQRGERKRGRGKREARWGREEERKIESGFGTNRDRDGASEGMEGASEKNAKMRAVAKRRAGYSEFDEDRTSTREGGYVPRRKERLRKRNNDAREERRTRRYEREWRREEGRAREETERVRHRADADERARRKRGLKKREGTRGKRGGTISRGSERERPRG